LVAEAKATLRGITRIGIKEFDIRMKDNEIEVYRVRAEVSFRIER
jgi:flavin-binding protein dodecin